MSTFTELLEGNSLACGVFNPHCSLCELKLTGMVPVLKFTIFNKVLDEYPNNMFWCFFSKEDNTVIRNDWLYCETNKKWYCEICNHDRIVISKDVCQNMLCNACNKNCHDMDLCFITNFIWKNKQKVDIDGYMPIMCRMRQRFVSVKAMDEVPCEGLSDYEKSYFRFVVLKLAGLGIYFKTVMNTFWIRSFIVCLHRMFEQLEDHNDYEAVAILNAVCNDTCVPVTEEEYMMFRLMHCSDPNHDGIFAADEIMYQKEDDVRRIYFYRLTRNNLTLTYPPYELKRDIVVPMDAITEIASRGTNLSSATSPCLHVDPRIPRPWRVSFMRQTVEVKKRCTECLSWVNANKHLTIEQFYKRTEDDLLLLFNVPLGLDLMADYVIGFYFDDHDHEMIIELQSDSLLSTEVFDDKFSYFIQGEINVIHVRGQYFSGTCPCELYKGMHKRFVCTINDVLEAEREGDPSLIGDMVWDDSNIETFLAMKNTRGIDFWRFAHNDIKEPKPLSISL